MPKLSVYDITGKATGEEIELNDQVFGVEFNEPVVHQAVVRQQANQRLGTHATKTKAVWFAAAAVSLGNKKEPAVLVQVQSVLQSG
jgi:ribosomal protein L4